ncbi:MULTISPECIES: TonB-dependent vitamin B12 receptor [Vibrio]|uniref:TonB-dependent vitamin B12 receptor n=1 Tax=Vibrio TaxID=662 RepID=UPI0003B229EA|nr:MULTISPECIES: TonB-dependent vitamin B12 receptor [Vibrio]UAB70185.1 TonB-dependent vitamin B12 receptor [Vibrio sp. SCSIO 43132]CCN69816.1 putative Vitamin B12 transporter BtuB [Vibrio nigripulchritudo SFn118]
MKKTLLATTVASLLTHASISVAQEAAETETLVVTANRFEQSTQSVLAPVNVVTRQEIIQTQAKSLPEVLRKLPGVEIAQNGGRGQLASVYVRGTGSDQVLVLIDGVRMAKSSTGSVDFNQVPVSQIERIEYVRGARAAMYGSEAIGGVINIITYSNTKNQAISNLSVGVGSRSQEANFDSVISTSESGKLAVTAGYEKDEGYNVKPVPGVNDGEKHGFSSINGSLGYRHNFNDVIEASVFARVYDNTYQYDNNSSSSRKTSESHVSSQVIGGSIGYTKDQLASTFSYSNEFGRSNTSNPYDLSASDQYRNVYKQDNVSWISSYEINESTQVSGGLDWRKDFYKDDKADSTQDRSNTGVFGVLSTKQEIVTVELSIRSDDNQDYGRNTTYNAGLGFDITESIQVFGSYGTAFKAPTLSQQNGSAWVGENKSLKPESSKNIDIGVKGTVKDIDWAVTGYDIKIDDLIDYDGNKRQYVNVEGQTRIKGVELEAAFETGSIFHAFSIDLKDPKNDEGEMLARRSKGAFKWNVSTSFDDVDLSLSYQYYTKRRNSDYDATPIYLKPYDLLDAAATYWVEPNVAIRGRVDNLLNEKYETANGYPAPERTIYLSIAYQF